MIFDKLFKKDKDSSKNTESKPVSEMDYYAEGKSQFNAGHYTQAMEYFQAAIAEFPDRENAYLKLSETYVAMGRQKDAVAILYKLISLQPDNAAAQQKVAQLQNLQPVEPQIICPEKAMIATENTGGGNQGFAVNGVSFEMVYVEGGTFTMGATTEQGSDAWDSEKPAHSVTLSSYYIGQTEVTQALWRVVMGGNPSNWKGSDLPVENVSWNACREFICKLNQITGKTFRLPTEAEWEYAARGGSKSRGYKYSGSNTIDAVAWYYRNSGNKTHIVGTKAPNELGLYDMNGNVLEWCQDWYGEYSSSARTNPGGPMRGDYRVNRGGSWGRGERGCRVSYRSHGEPDYCHSALGLRLALQLDNIATQQAVSKNAGGGRSSNANHIQQKIHKQRFSSILNPKVFRYVLYSVTTLNVIQMCAAISRITSWGVWNGILIGPWIGLLGTIIVIGVPAFLTIGGVMMIEQDVTVNLKKTNILFIVLNFALIATLYYLSNPRLWSWHHLWLLVRPLVFLVCVFVAIVVIYYMGRGLYHVFIYMAKKIVEFFTT